jgi:hypothetical protein
MPGVLAIEDFLQTHIIGVTNKISGYKPLFKQNVLLLILLLVPALVKLLFPCKLVRRHISTEKLQDALSAGGNYKIEMTNLQAYDVHANYC